MIMNFAGPIGEMCMPLDSSDICMTASYLTLERKSCTLCSGMHAAPKRFLTRDVALILKKRKEKKLKTVVVYPDILERLWLFLCLPLVPHF